MSQVHRESRALQCHITSARHQADQAAVRAGVVIKELTTPEKSQAAANLLDVIWNKESGGAAPIEAGLLIALEHAGNYVVGAFEGERMVAAAIGFFGSPAAAVMHSHIAGVTPAFKGGGVGTALKLHQRHWCLEREVTTLEWTFDPLILRNAGFNLNKLGARLEEYLPHFYGQMRDSTNAGQGSDRALVRWHLSEPVAPPIESVMHHSAIPLRLKIGEDGAPMLVTVPENVDVVGLEIPTDIESIRVSSPELSAQWRVALRESMHPLMESGWRVGGVTREGTYVVHR